MLAMRAGLALAGLLVVAGSFYLAARRQAETNARLASTNAALATTNARLATETARQLYVADMSLAFQAWDGGNVPRNMFLEITGVAQQPYAFSIKISCRRFRG